MTKHLLPFIIFATLLLACDNSHEVNDDAAFNMLVRVADLNTSGNKQAAEQLADSALAIATGDTTRCWLLCEKTVAQIDMGLMAQGIATAHEAMALAQAMGDVDAMLNLRGSMGVAYRRMGQLDSALAHYDRGIELAVREGNTEYEVYLDNCVAVLFGEANRNDEAIAYAQKAERAALTAGDTIEWLSAKANVGGIRIRQQRWQEALDATLPMWPMVMEMDYNAITLKYLSVILNAYAMTGDYESMEAFMPHADKALQGVSPTSAGALGITQIKMQLLGQQRRYAEQMVLIDSLMAMSATNRVMPLERLMQQKALCLEAMGRHHEAVSMMTSAFQMLDSVKQSDIERGMNEFAVKYGSLEKDLQLEQAKRENVELENRTLWLAMAVAALLAVVGVMLYRRKIARQRALLSQRASYISGLESERERLAKELHDGVCNDLLATTMLLATDATRAQSQLRGVWRDVRHLSHELMPPRFDSVTLAQAVSNYAQAASADGEHHIDLCIDQHFDWSSLPQQAAYQIYRIVQEATANALKHGDTSDIEMALQAQQGCINVTIANGTNTAGEPSATQHGIGADTMRQRANSIGATLTTSTNDGIHTVSLTYHTRK